VRQERSLGVAEPAENDEPSTFNLNLFSEIRDALSNRRCLGYISFRFQNWSCLR